MRSNRSRIGALLASLFLGLHLAALPASLEDLDSINFALGIRDFDVAQHQPHPPGYPVFVIASKAVFAIGRTLTSVVGVAFTEAHALGLISIVAGSLAVFALLGLFGELDRDRRPGPFTWIATLLVVTCPLYWITASRPLSDMAGLSAALAIQALIVRAASARGLGVAALGAGLAAGIRSQVIWLTIPLLLAGIWRQPSAARAQALWRAGVGYFIGAVIWLVPLMWASGGVSAYWRALSDQGTEDLTGVAMLATNPTPRQLATALHYTFIAPWGYWPLATFVLLLAVTGAVTLFWRARPALVWLVAGFAPYMIFHLLFQESITTRYALPLVVPIAYAAVRGVAALPQTLAVGAALTVAGFAIVIDDGVLYRFARTEAPSFRMLADMDVARDNAGNAFTPPALAMHRREHFDFRRPIQWVGEQFPPLAVRLPATPKHEWLELVKYWNGGGRAPIWFVADPLRSDLALIRYDQRPTLYRWSFAPTILVGGSRPSEMDWHVIEPPQWYLGEGWALTPETAGIAKEDRKGPGLGGSTGWVRRSPERHTLLLGGRNFGAVPARLTVTIDGVEAHAADIPPGFFLRMVDVPTMVGAGDYAIVEIDASLADLAIEQFDAQPAGRLVYGFDEGWNEQEYNPTTGVLWRWSSDRATLRVRAEGHRLALSMRGEVEAASSSHVTIRAGERVIAEFEADREFSRTVLIPADAVAQSESVITIESSAWYVPAEKKWRSADRRKLGLKLTECRLSPVS